MGRRGLGSGGSFFSSEAGRRDRTCRMTKITRRAVLGGGVAAAGLGFLRMPAWTSLVEAQSETLVPFTDIPATFNPTPSATVRYLDLRRIDGPLTPADQFFTTQHYGHPDIDLAAHRLKITGLVARPASYAIDDLRRLGAVDLVAGFECSGNSKRTIEGLAGNGRWTGVPLRVVLDRAGVKADAREFVFFGADHGSEDVEFRNQKFTVDQQFGRSL